MKDPKITVTKVKTGIIRSLNNRKITKEFLEHSSQVLVGNVVHVHLNVASTKFDVEDFVIKSKKLRSDVTIV